MELSERDTQRLPEMQNTKQAGSICKMGMIKLSVKDYMNSQHAYIETSSERFDGTVKIAPTASTSIPEMLQLCEVDPVDLLIDLGFGSNEPDICNKIPSRFIMTPSEAKGINTMVFLEAQRKRMEIENPNLCGRFRQLEVLEQVTNAFSSLLQDVHNVQNGDDQEGKSATTSTLTQEKRKRIRQLLWKIYRQAKIAEENPSPHIIKAETNEYKDIHEPLKDTNNLEVFESRQNSKEESQLEDLSEDHLPSEDNGDALSERQEPQLCTFSTPVKPYNLPDTVGKGRTLKISRVLPKIFQKTFSQHRQKTTNSFEFEEVQSFEEDYPSAINQDRLSEITRTNSCQSDSSGFQEEPPELLPLQTLHDSSQSTDSQITSGEKCNSTAFKRDWEKDDKETFLISPRNSELQKNKEQFKSLSMNTENGQILQGFENQPVKINDKKNMLEMDEQKSEDTSDCARYQKYIVHAEQLTPQESQTTEVSPEDYFPIYITHDLSVIKESNHETSSEINDNDMTNLSERCVSDLQKCDSDRDSFADDECSVELSNIQWTPSRMYDFKSYTFPTQTTEGSIDYSDEEMNNCYEDKKSTFQTEINTNIYKSVTIQMASPLMQDSSERFNRYHSFYNPNTIKSDEHTMLHYNAEKKEAFSQTDMRWWRECCTNNHYLHDRNYCLTESLSFDTGLTGLSHPHPALSTHCCHSYHYHHCCIPRCHKMHRHHISMRSSDAYNIEKELSDTLKLLRESLINVSLNTDQDMEKMKKACQHFREKLIEIEQCLIEQQAGCFNILTNEEREKIRTLHLLRRNVIKEALELELNLDERAHHVKETIAMQLNQVLEEQSNLYSELELCDWEKDNNHGKPYGKLFKSNSSPSTSSLSTFNVSKEDTSLNQAEPETQAQKMDLTTILKNIKKTFRNLSNS